MNGWRNAGPFAPVIDVLNRAGKPGRELGVRLDLLRSTGMRYAWRRRSEDARVSKLGADPARRGYTAVWREAAEELGADVVDLSDGFLEIRKENASTRVWRHWVTLDDAVTLRLALNKPLVYRLLSSAGLPVPEHLTFDAGDPSPALLFLSRTPSPCVLKPAADSGGSGTTSGVRTPGQLRRATLRAARLQPKLLIERQLSGDVYRLLFLDGELLDTVRRSPPRVTGDGRSTIEQLIAAENERRLAAAVDRVPSLLRIDLDCIFTLEAAGLRLRSVLPPGVTAAVKTVVSQNRREENETVRDGLSPDVIAAAAAAARVVGVRLAGVDVITPDAAVPLAESGGVILEVNGTPGLHYHYEVADRENATRVAVPVLRKLLGL